MPTAVSRAFRGACCAAFLAGLVALTGCDDTMSGCGSMGATGGCATRAPGPLPPDVRAAKRAYAFTTAEVRGAHATVRRLTCAGARIRWTVPDLGRHTHVDFDGDASPVDGGWSVRMDVWRGNAADHIRTITIRTEHGRLCVSAVRSS